MVTGSSGRLTQISLYMYKYMSPLHDCTVYLSRIFEIIIVHASNTVKAEIFGGFFIFVNFGTKSPYLN